MKLKCMLKSHCWKLKRSWKLKRWWGCCAEGGELGYRLDVMRELWKDRQSRTVAISEGKLSLPGIPLDILIDANHFNIHVENGRVDIKATVLKKR